MKRKFSKKAAIIVAAILAAAAIVGVLIAGGVDQEPPVTKAKIQTPYIDLILPVELEGYISNDETTYGNVYTRAFYMNYGGMEIPLWRVDFGDPYSGDWIGVLKTEQGDIHVAMTGFVASDEDLEALGEEGARLYSECIQGYTAMLDGIVSDPRFTTERPLAIGAETKVELTYWQVTLPDTMKVAETFDGDNYEAVFSAEVAGVVVPLYRVCVGEKQAASALGYHEVNGVKQPVSIESFEFAEYPDWTEDDYAAAYRMMDTINAVIETIMQSKQFSAEAG